MTSFRQTIHSATILAACTLFSTVAVVPASAAEKPADLPKGQSGFCDIYGPGFEPVAGTGVCVKIGGSIAIGISSGGHPGALATSSNWITTKPAPQGN